MSPVFEVVCGGALELVIDVVVVVSKEAVVLTVDEKVASGVVLSVVVVELSTLPGPGVPFESA